MKRIANSMKTATCVGMVVGATLAAPGAHAVDGVIEINAASAAGGGITAGDAPGFPVTISEQGSYRLTSDLEVPGVNTTGIEISADFVTIDLNGFTLFSTGGGAGTGHGIRGFDSRTGIVVKNGTVRSMGSSGILMPGRRGRVENVLVSQNRDDGIRLGDHGMVRECTASNNAGFGITVGDGGSLIENKSWQNGFASVADHGLGLGDFGVAIGNTSTENTGVGLLTGDGATIVNNNFSDNSEDGARTGNGSLLRGNTARGNGSLGFRLGSASGYGGNVLTANFMGSVLGGVEIDTNVCGTNAVCP